METLPRAMIDLEIISSKHEPYPNTYYTLLEKFKADVNQLSFFKLFLYKYIYSNMNFINSLSYYLDKLDIFNVVYSNGNYYLKVKKTNIRRKYPDFRHDVMFYYELINLIFYKFFEDNYYEINNYLNLYRHEFGLVYELKYYYHFNILNFIYKITTVSDNVVIISI